VDVCIDAAAHEFGSVEQQHLLRAATFGKTFLELYAPEKFVDMCRSLRVLNAVRHHEIGLPLTYPQYPPSPLPIRSLSLSLALCCVWVLDSV
jgi:hypothetical protein